MSAELVDEGPELLVIVELKNANQYSPDFFVLISQLTYLNKTINKLKCRYNEVRTEWHEGPAIKIWHRIREDMRGSFWINDIKGDLRAYKFNGLTKMADFRAKWAQLART